MTVERVHLDGLTPAQRRKLLVGGPSRSHGATAAKLPKTMGVADWGGWELVFEVPGDPVPWARPKEAKHGRFTATKQRDAGLHVQQLVIYAMGPRRPLAGPVEVFLWFYRRTRVVADGSNLQKLVEDALIGHAVCDDDQIKDWHGHVRLDPDRPRTLVRVRPGPDDAVTDWGGGCGSRP